MPASDSFTTSHVSILLVTLPIAAFFVSAGLTAWIRKLTIARKLMDVPNARSSHSVATPRGGGVAIALSALLAFAALGATGAANWATICGVVGAGAFIAVVGIVDDAGHVAPRWRLLAHFAAAAWILAWLGGFPQLPVFGAEAMPGWVGNALAALYLVWLLNLTNFMDGIDGIASVETITVTLAGAALYIVFSPGGTLWLPPVILASATLGFLMWNWPPAKIFMGDSGSGFLGVTLGALSVQAARTSPALFWSWLILLGVFIVDATVTLARRAFRRERIYEAHRSHAYQHAATRWGHATVTIAVGLINICWLLPIALIVGFGRLDGRVALLIAYVPLVVVASFLRAGTPAST